MHYDVIIIGGGPAGLACAATLAEQNRSVLLIERKETCGPKVCAGGITWSGLINRVPDSLIEGRFPTQHIVTPLQRCTITEKQPIIATVNRENLGEHMAASARSAGAILHTACRVDAVDGEKVTYTEMQSGSTVSVGYTVLVGADGATSIVRKHLGLDVRKYGVGINYQIPGTADNMEWHLDWRSFRNGYGWIFPHRNTVSVGAYGDPRYISPAKLKEALLGWAATLGYELRQHKPRAEIVNYDYRGWNFGNTFLVGEAAGLASGLTGEGIYPAILSGEIIGKYIVNQKSDLKKLERLLRMHGIHDKMVTLSGKNRFLTTLLFEFITAFLRSGLVDFRKLEMAH